jgi:Zn-dependent protease with chaperone function
VPIRTECQSCHAVFVAKNEHAGKWGKCPECKAAIQVPVIQAVADAQIPDRSAVSRAEVAADAPASAVSIAGTVGNAQGQLKPVAAARSPAPPQQPLTIQQELLAAFRGDIPRVKVPILYRLGILLSALVMVLLPLIYAAMIGLTCLAVYSHATRDTALLQTGAGRTWLLMVLVYLAPILVGTILVLFMLKPLFARPLMMGRRRSLTRLGEPVLFAFVDRVCQAVGARPPARINVDWQLNASAGLDEGWLKLFSNRLVLTIGTPLVAALDAGEFAGVLAHEFGHFTQGTGRRLTYLVRSINYWFLRVVYQRDAWDQALEELANDLNWRISWILHLARLGVVLSRRVLWLLMMVGHVVSSFMLRQMEFHADAHEARLVGGKVFESTVRKIALQGVVYQAVFHDLRQFVNRRQLPDDLSLLMLAKCRQVSPDGLQQIGRQLLKTRTGWFDTHPADRDRIRRAYREGAETVFADHRPATDMFTDFKSLSRNTTWDLYRACFGSRFQPSKMQAAEEVIRSQRPSLDDPLPPIKLD